MRKEGSPAHREPKGAQTDSNQYPRDHSMPHTFAGTAALSHFPTLEILSLGTSQAEWGPRTPGASPQSLDTLEQDMGLDNDTNTARTQGSSVLLKTRESVGFVT